MVEISTGLLASACETWPLPEDGSDCTFQSREGTTVTLAMRAAP